MPERTLDELGPVDYVIVEFPAGAQNFTGEGADELLRLHDAGIIRVMDILILAKGEDGTVMAQELGDLDDLGALGRLEAELAETLAEEDVDNLAAAMAPGSIAGVLVYENLWAAPFASAIRRAGAETRSRPPAGRGVSSPSHGHQPPPGQRRTRARERADPLVGFAPGAARQPARPGHPRRPGRGGPAG